MFLLKLFRLLQTTRRGIDMEKNESLGTFETVGYVAALAGADAALKTAEVRLLGCRYVGSGLVSVLLAGDVSSVKVAVEAGCAAAQQVGDLKWQTVIARTAEGLDLIVAEPEKKSQKKGNSSAKSVPRSSSAAPRKRQSSSRRKKIPQLSQEELDGMRVIKLREVARLMPGLALNRQQIRSARKDDLIAAITSYYRNEKE
jgi:microcompartment protein CcmL/EutN